MALEHLDLVSISLSSPGHKKLTRKYPGSFHERHSIFELGFAMLSLCASQSDISFVCQQRILKYPVMYQSCKGHYQEMENNNKSEAVRLLGRKKRETAKEIA